MSRARRPVPSPTGRLLKASRAMSGHGSAGAWADAGPMPKARAAATMPAVTVTRRLWLMAPHLFPFELGIGRRGVAGIIVLKQRPAIFFRLAGRLGRGRDGHAVGNGAAHVAGQTLEITPLIRQGGRQ